MPLSLARWHGAVLHTVEHAALRTIGPPTLSGVVVGPSIDLRYRVDLDEVWHTRAVSIELSDRTVTATNTPPIRRLTASGDARATLAVAWFPWPDLTADALEQCYERLGERRWRYTAGSFSAVLDVDDQGLVLRYVTAAGTVWTVS